MTALLLKNIRFVGDNLYFPEGDDVKVLANGNLESNLKKVVSIR